jgi:hypothetical protein
MADKITTLKTKGNDNVYPNVLDQNIPETIARNDHVNQAFVEVEGKIAGKQDKLTAGANITIQGNVISATGGSVPDNVVLYGDLTPVA